MAVHTGTPAFTPAVPKSLDELGIGNQLVSDLMLRRLLLEGVSSTRALGLSLKLSGPIIDTLFRHLRHQQLVEVKGMAGNDYHLSLTAAGKQQASDRFQVSQYAGACPVPLTDYHRATRAQAGSVFVNRATLREAFHDLVLPDRVLDSLGPALISRNPIFLYGPSGNGKTSIAERLLRVYKDAVMIPYAVEVDNQIISQYDPVVHVPVEVAPDDAELIDSRWVLCRRPCIVTGGELIPEMLELRLDTASGVYSAPLQMKANNGLFIVDDFGRQPISPRELLNRWIVPLDRRIDFLTLRYGVSFQVPFELTVVFSTNLDPHDLADEAFLRRIRNKIEVEAVDPRAFDVIFQRVVADRGMKVQSGSVEYLRRRCQDRSGSPALRACYPTDICNLLESIGRYEDRQPEISQQEIDRAIDLYFAKSL